MKLYDAGRAPNPRRVQIFLKEKGVVIEDVIQLDLNKHEHKSAEVVGKNPTKTVPFLELDDGTVISETVAICRYLEALHPEPNLFGEGGLEQAKVEMWNRRVEFGFMAPVAFAFRHLHPGAAVLEPEQIANWGTLNKQRALDYMPLLDEQLGKSEFLARDAFSVADITLFVSCQFLKPARIEIPEGMVHLRRWYEQVSARPSTAL